MAAKKHTVTHAEMLEHLLGVDKINVPKILKEEERLGFSYEAAHNVLAALKYYEEYFGVCYEEAVDLVKYVDHFAKNKYFDLPECFTSLEEYDVSDSWACESDCQDADENGEVNESVLERVRSIVKKYYSNADVLGCCKVRYFDENGNFESVSDTEYCTIISSPSITKSVVVVDLKLEEITDGVIHPKEVSEWFDFRRPVYEGTELINKHIEENNGYESLDPHRYDMDSITGYMYKFGLPFEPIGMTFSDDGQTYKDYHYNEAVVLIKEASEKEKTDNLNEAQYKELIAGLEKKYGLSYDEAKSIKKMIEDDLASELAPALWDGAEYDSQAVDSAAEKFFSHNAMFLEKNITPVMEQRFKKILNSTFKNAVIQGLSFKEYDDCYSIECCRVYFSSDEILPTSFVCLARNWESVDTDNLEDVLISGLLKRVDERTNKIYVTLL